MLFCNSIYFYLAIYFRNISMYIHTPNQYLLVFYSCIAWMPVMDVRMWWLSSSLSKCNRSRSLQLPWDSSPCTGACFSEAASRQQRSVAGIVSLFLVDMVSSDGWLWPEDSGGFAELSLEGMAFWEACTQSSLPLSFTEVRLVLQPDSFHSLIWLPPNVPSYMHSP